jgi:hypothetical protein
MAETRLLFKNIRIAFITRIKIRHHRPVLERCDRRLYASFLVLTFDPTLFLRTIFKDIY